MRPEAALTAETAVRKKTAVRTETAVEEKAAMGVETAIGAETAMQTEAVQDQSLAGMSAEQPAGPPSEVLRLEPFCVWLAHHPGDSGKRRPPRPAELSAAIRNRLAAADHPGAQPLRWAITAVDPQRGLQLEGVVVYGSAAADNTQG